MIKWDIEAPCRRCGKRLKWTVYLKDPRDPLPDAYYALCPDCTLLEDSPHKDLALKFAKRIADMEKRP